MILRQFMKHVTEQNWIAVCLDVLVVITGILISLQVAEWHQNTKDQQRYVLLHQELLDEVKGSIERQHKLFDIFKAPYDHIEVGIQAIDLDSSVSIDEKLVTTALDKASWHMPNIRLRGVVDEVMFSENIRQLVPRDSAKEITKYYNEGEVNLKMIRDVLHGNRRALSVLFQHVVPATKIANEAAGVEESIKISDARKRNKWMLTFLYRYHQDTIKLLNYLEQDSQQTPFQDVPHDLPFMQEGDA